MGVHSGTTINVIRTEKGNLSVHRARMLDNFVALIPPERCHFGKRITNIEDTGSYIVLQFKDGTSAEADVVISADGLHSVTRRHILGDSHAAAKSVFGNAVVYRRLVPMKEAVELVGAEYAGTPMFLWGQGKVSVSYPIDKGDMLNIAIVNVDHDEAWTRGFGKQELTQGDREMLLHGWGKEGRAVAQVCYHTLQFLFSLAKS
jgi:salicylate hydroxylase